jgi:serine/threonine-protein kinase
MPEIGPSDKTTIAPDSASETRRGSSGSHSGWLSSSQPGDGHFAAGTILAERYRIIGLLGRGGMGEVFRADDLRLGQPVALKFLPSAVAGDAVRLAQFHNEVRTARQVSHRNVCRVYDIGEADSRIFLTMEYVDGEDLATLLRRIGRFPQDRAIEIARQLCAGLAAAHEQQVLHRDLKPANVMLDRDGRVRITDFGLAGLAGEIHDIRAGTPAYMAPEQLAGREVSMRSDIFALGLVLFEIFTGRRAYDAKNVAELLRMHDHGLALTPTSAVRDLDPSIERVILRCLDREPARRPPSAIAVSAALPGGDPLAAALAAGETPSPEMVANAGAREAISPVLGLVALAIILVTMAVATMFASQVQTVHRIPFDKAPEVLADRARTILDALGYRGKPVDTASGFQYSHDYERWVEANRTGPDRWRELTTGRAPTALFWYRTSPRVLVPSEAQRRVTPNDPPLIISDMTLVVLDTEGRLVQFQAVPPQVDPPSADAAPAPPDYRPLFAAASFPMDRFTSAAPTTTPAAFADARAAWTGTLPELGNTPVRVEASSYRSRLTSLYLVFPWTRPTRMTEAATSGSAQIAQFISVVIYVGMLAVAAIMAKRNLHLNRGDRSGAIRVGVVAFLLMFLQFVFSTTQVREFDAWSSRLFTAIGLAMFNGASLWVFYLALEPIVRRIWPDGLITWTRLLSGEWRDPLVGWHVLVGIADGVILMLLLQTSFLLPLAFGQGPVAPAEFGITFLSSTGNFVASLLDGSFEGINAALFTVFLYAIARYFIHREIIARLAVIVVFAAAIASGFVHGKQPIVEVALVLGISAFVVGLLRRFGLLAITMMFVVAQLLTRAPLTFTPSVWYGYAAIWTYLLILALALYGFVTSRAGAPLFGRSLAGDPAES